MLKQERLKLELVKSKSYLDISDVSLISGYSPSTIRRRIKEGKLKALQNIPQGKLLFKRSDIAMWLENGAV